MGPGIEEATSQFRDVDIRTMMQTWLWIFDKVNLDQEVPIWVLPVFWEVLNLAKTIKTVYVMWLRRKHANEHLDLFRCVELWTLKEWLWVLIDLSKRIWQIQMKSESAALLVVKIYYNKNANLANPNNDQIQTCWFQYLNLEKNESNPKI